MDGHPFTFQGVNFSLSHEGVLEVSIDSSWNFENITAETAREDLSQAEVVYQSLRRQSASFAAIVENRPPQFVLIYDTGNAAVELGRLVGQRMVWAKGFPA